MVFKRKAPKRYLNGDERDRVFFAWLPLSFRDGGDRITIWLEKVEIRERYYNGYAGAEWERIAILDYESKPREQKP